MLLKRPIMFVVKRSKLGLQKGLEEPPELQNIRLPNYHLLLNSSIT